MAQYLTLHVLSSRLPSNVLDSGPRKRISRYTLSIFRDRAREIHGDKYDYSAISELDFKEGAKSCVAIRCKTCNYIWVSTVHNHISNKSGCKSCAGLIPITYDIFMERIQRFYGDKYKFPGLIPRMIQNVNSEVDVLCRLCGYEWSTKICNLMRGKNCLQCVNNIRWTPERFLIRAREIHGEKFDYSDISISQIKHKESQIKVICRKCDYVFYPTVHRHINGRSGCRQCCGLLKWTLETFIKRAKEIHGDRYDYRLITESHIENQRSRVPIICNKCCKTWDVIVDSHINAKSGCRHCNKSKGEIACEKYLTNILFQIWIENVSISCS
jgi:formylmethanofuran dehydrogenase subunit E